MSNENKTLKDKGFKYGNRSYKNFCEDDVKQAVKEAYGELIDMYWDTENFEIPDKIKEIFKNKFGFELE